MTARKADKQIDDISHLISDLFEIDAVYRQGRQIVFSLSYRYLPTRSTKALQERLELAGYEFTTEQAENSLTLQIDPRRRLNIPRLNIILFLATLVSVYFVPVWYFNFMDALVKVAKMADSGAIVISGEMDLIFRALPLSWTETMADFGRGEGLEFTLAIMSILFVHEMGHFIASRRRHIITSWPYFIPAPNIIGTFGAIIKSKSPFRNRRDLIEVGSAGPIAGWIVALFWLIYGLSQSHYMSLDQFTPQMLSFSLDGESILMRVATLTLIGEAPDGSYYKLTEAAFAGWVGLLVTAINMLPIGQLDGGHVIYGLARRKQHILGFIGLAALLILGFQSMVWWFFAAIGLVFGVKHPPTMDDSRRPSLVARAMGITALIILVLSFTPVPFR